MPTLITQKQLDRLKDGLPLYRKILGYSAEKFGSFLGLNQQQISSLETGRTRLTQVHFLAISQIITVSISEIQNETEINIALIIILVLLQATEDDLDDEEYKSWKNILTQFSKIDDIGNSENQIKLLKGFAIASMDLNEGEIIPTIDILNDIIDKYREYLLSIQELENKN
jgi:transcriptional regulator with XRE-family HTH domain